MTAIGCCHWLVLFACSWRFLADPPIGILESVGLIVPYALCVIGLIFSQNRYVRALAVATVISGLPIPAVAIRDACAGIASTRPPVIMVAGTFWVFQIYTALSCLIVSLSIWMLNELQDHPE